MGRRRLIEWLCLGFLLTSPMAAGDQTAADLPPWQALRFEASKLFLTAKMEVRLEKASRQAADTLLPSPEGRPFAPSDPSLWTVELTSSAVGRRSRSRVWFDPKTHSAWQRAKEKLGSKPYDKVSRFTRDGVYTRRRAPINSQQTEQPPETWGKVQTRFEPYPGWQASGLSQVLADGGDGPCRAILEPSQLLYVLGILNLDAPPENLCIFSDGTISRLRFEPRGSTALNVDFTESKGTGTAEQRRQERLDARCVIIRSLTLDGQAGGELELLGLEGDVEIFLDSDRGLPLEIRGKLPNLGSVKVRLVGVELG